MASGRVHAEDSIVGGPVGGLILCLLHLPLWVCAVFALGSWTGTILSPDLDADHKTFAENSVYRFHWFIGMWFHVFWLPYAICIPHRSDWSHFPILGTALRLLYLWPVWIGPVYLNLVPETVFPVVVVWVAGLAFSDLLHWFRDGLYKRRRPQLAWGWQTQKKTRRRKRWRDDDYYYEYRGCY